MPNNLFFAKLSQVLIVLLQFLNVFQTSSVEFQQVVKAFMQLEQLGLGCVQFSAQMVHRGNIQLKTDGINELKTN